MSNFEKFHCKSKLRSEKLGECAEAFSSSSNWIVSAVLCRFAPTFPFIWSAKFQSSPQYTPPKLELVLNRSVSVNIKNFHERSKIAFYGRISPHTVVVIFSGWNQLGNPKRGKSQKVFIRLKSTWCDGMKHICGLVMRGGMGSQ